MEENSSDFVRHVDSEPFFEVAAEALERGNRVSFTPNGRSMLPTIRGGIDTVVLRKPSGPFRRLDVILFRRRNGTFVLHRVIGHRGTSLIVCGDHQTRPETVEPDQVMAVAETLVRGPRRTSFRSFASRFRAEIRVLSRPLRALLARGKRGLKRALKIGKI